MLTAWTENSIPSYSYEEATGYLISLLGYLFQITGQERFRHEALRSAEALIESIGKRNGCGRNGKIYLFDSAIVLRALHLLMKTGSVTEDDDQRQAIETMLHLLASTCREMLDQRLGCLAETNECRNEHWSKRFNFHLLKALAHLHAFETETTVQAELRHTAEQLLRQHYREGLFCPVANHAGTNLHAHCYAVEGILLWGDLLEPTWKDDIREMAAVLAQTQTPAGALPNTWPPSDDAILLADATAQAVRIWQCVDAEKFAGPIKQGLTFLRSLAQSEGGFFYSPDLPHTNSWTTIFTIQALLWQHIGADAGWLI